MPTLRQRPCPRLLYCSAALAASLAPVSAQTPVPPQTASSPGAPIGRTQAQDVQVTGDVRLRNGEMQLGNGSTITAGSDAIPIALTRGGELRVCATSSVHLARDRSIDAPDATGLMLGLDRGAIEARYTTGKYSDVLLTPDLRILISGPGTADLSIRVSRQGDTCIDNRGQNAPYITVTSQLEGGVYRVQPGQHVSFQHGSLHEVVDTEREPCGCPPPPQSVAAAAAPAAPAPAAKVGGPSSTPADTQFPLAVSEGLTPTAPESTVPVAARGETHAQVAVPFSYHAVMPAAPLADAAAATPPAIPAASPAAPAPVPSNMAPAAVPAPRPAAPAVVSPRPAVVATAVPVVNVPVQAARPRPQGQPARRFFRRMGHFFSRLFGAEQGG